VAKDKCDQFKPYTSLINKEILAEGQYKNTLFRFPLRTKASKLSDTVYDSKHLMDVLESFQAEAHLVLLFLKHITRIRIYHKINQSNRANMLFQVRVTDDCVKEAQKKRKQFYEMCHSVHQDTDAKVCYVINIETEKYIGSDEPVIKRYSWLVTEYKAGEGKSVKLRTLSQSDKLSSVALVGIAIDLMHIQSPCPSSSAGTLMTQPLSGKVFCHLPLPGEETGLPVHVNGYFAISQNRCHLKWPTAGYKPGSDEYLDWNQCLLSELMPKSYLDLIDSVIMFDIGKSDVERSEVVHHLLPNLALTDEKWCSVVDEIYKNLKYKKFLYTEAREGRWLSIEEIVIFGAGEDDEDTLQLINAVLLQCDVNITCVPIHVLEALKHYYDDVVVYVTPEVVQRAMMEHPDSYRNRNWEEKVILLNYLLRDGNCKRILGNIQCYICFTPAKFQNGLPS